MSKEWMTAKEAAAYAKCGVQSIYNGVKRRKLRAARLNGTHQLRFVAEWLDEWLIADSTIELVNVPPDTPLLPTGMDFRKR
jgi:excisionase family DNA binding protein